MKQIIISQNLRQVVIPSKIKSQLAMILAFVTILNLFFLIESSAQFQNASLTENAAGVTVVSRSTGNDILDLSGNTYRVSVWDDAVNHTNHGLSWEVDYSGNFYSGTIAFTINADVYDPDVVLIYDATGVYAFVVYYEAGSVNKYYWEAFKWTSGGGWSFQSAYSATSFETANFGITLNVDADNIGNFAIVWDDQNPRVKILTGNISSGSFVFNNSGAPVIIKTGAIKPDVCSFYDNSNKYVYVTYIDNNNGNLKVDRHSVSTLASGSAGSLTNQLNASTGGGFYFNLPRIACPNQHGNLDDWTVVFEETDNSTYYIDGFNNYSGSVSSKIVYNDNSQFPHADLSVVPNGLPVVTYDDQSPVNIWVGWTLDNRSGTLNGPPYSYNNVVDALYPIVLKCDDYCIPVASITYWQVPTSLTVANGDEVNILSLSGRFATDRLYLTYNENIINGSTVDDIYTKEATPSSATSLKFLQNAFMNQPPAQSNNNIFVAFNNELKLTFEIYNIQGRIIFQTAGKPDEIRSAFLNKKFTTPSVYFVKAFSEDGKYSITRKIFIGN